MWGQDLTSLFWRGGPVMWPLLACSVVALAISLERGIVFLWYYGSFDRLARQLQNLAQRRELPEMRRLLAADRNPVARVVETYLDEIDAPPAARDDVVGRVASQQICRLEERLNWLSIIGHLAPMLGLLGTVAGLVQAFHQIEQLGGQAQAGDLAAGIWAALLTTAFGLVIALPTLAVHHLLDARAATVALQMQWIVSYLNQWLQLAPSARTANELRHHPPADDPYRVGSD